MALDAQEELTDLRQPPKTQISPVLLLRLFRTEADVTLPACCVLTALSAGWLKNGIFTSFELSLTVYVHRNLRAKKMC